MQCCPFFFPLLCSVFFSSSEASLLSRKQPLLPLLRFRASIWKPIWEPILFSGADLRANSLFREPISVPGVCVCRVRCSFLAAGRVIEWTIIWLREC